MQMFTPYGETRVLKFDQSEAVHFKFNVDDVNNSWKKIRCSGTCIKGNSADHYLVIAKVRERLAVGKQAAQRFGRQTFNLRKLNEPEVREQYQIEITNRFAALEKLNDDKNVNRIWENIKENIQTSAKESLGVHELKQNKPWFDEECLDFLDQRKRAKMQWIQDRSQSNVDFLNNVSHEVSRHFRNKKKAYMRAKIEEFETNSKIQNMV